MGLFDVDGHVRAYHGGQPVPKHHVARMRITMPAEEDVWLNDARGDGLLVWEAPPGASLAGELRTATAHIRELVGPDARPTVCFDRGGWSPKLFAELSAADFDILTYRKGHTKPEPKSAFAACTHVDEAGRTHHYELADRSVRIAYRDHRGKLRRFAARQITRRSPNGHQTHVITTRRDLDAAAVAHAMFSRWRQENFFRYLRHRYALDACTTTPDDPDRMVPNPDKPPARARVADAEQSIAEAQAHYDRNEGAGVPAAARADHDTFAADLAAARAELADRQAQAAATPPRAPVSDARPASRRLDDERKRIHDAVRVATYNAEFALARLLAAHYPRADDEARTLLGEIFTAPTARLRADEPPRRPETTSCHLTRNEVLSFVS
jgi:hypothetical protein